MGCGQSAVAMDEDDHDRYMKKTGLYSDKKYGNIRVYSSDADVVKDSALKELTKEETIKAIIMARHRYLAEQEFRQEMEERKLYEQLKNKY